MGKVDGVTKMSKKYKPEHSTGTYILNKSDKRKANAIDWIVYFIVPLAVLLLLRFVLFGLFIIPSGSMEYTLPVGSRIVTQNVGLSASTLHRGDVVVFEDSAGWLSNSSLESAASSSHFLASSSKQYLVKRLIGLPGDTVSCDGNGEPVKVNGVAIDESSYIRTGVNPSDMAFSVTVPDDSIFVLGDNRSNSADSRYHSNDGNSGCVPISSVTGVGLAVFWPLSSAHTLGSGRAAFARAGL